MDLFGVGFRRPDLIPLYFGEQVARAGRHHTQIAGGLEEAEALRDAFVDLDRIARGVTHRYVVLFSRRENFVHGLFDDRVIRLSAHTQREGQVVDADEQHVNARHGSDLLDVVNGLFLLDDDYHQDILIGELRIVAPG